MSDRYNLHNLKKAFLNPRLIKSEAKQLIQRAYGLVTKPIILTNNYHFKHKFGDGVNVMKEDWDNLILLDACRYDYFDEMNRFEGDLRPVVSQGSNSWEFLEQNFEGESFHDTIYVTANPHVSKLSENTFYTVENLLDRWEHPPGTVPSEEVVSASIKIHEEYPNKKLIIHFMQPHDPHLGPTAQEYRERIKDEIKGWTGSSIEHEGMTETQAAQRGLISDKEFVQAYKETLSIVLEHVDQLLDELNGKTVISSDHGQMLTKRRPDGKKVYGHPHDLKNKELCVVPWLEITNSCRRSIVSDDPIGYRELEEDIVNNRLESLGYKPKN